MSENDQKDPEKTQMTNPPAGTTKMVAPEGRKKVKVEAITDISIRLGPKQIQRYKPGEVFEVTPEMAAELCKPKQGFYAFSGERFGDDANQRHLHVRAKMVKENPA